MSEEPLGILLLPGALEGLSFEVHARRLLSIPRVIALEPSRFRTPRWLRDSASLRQAKRLRLPGEPRLVVLYEPAQYPLARALLGRYEAELWYAEPGAPLTSPGVPEAELAEYDELARAHARAVITAEDDAGLRRRLTELEIISPRPFVPGADRPPRLRG